MATSSRVPTISVSFVFLCVLFLAVACGDNAVPAGRTGIRIIDTVIDAIETNDPNGLVSLVRLEEVPCVRGGPTEITPLCTENQATGTIVETFSWNVCLGLQLGATTKADVAAWIVEQGLSLVGVFEVPITDEPAARYLVLFDPPDPAGTPQLYRGSALTLSDAEILSSEGYCGQSANEITTLVNFGDPILLGE